MQTNSESSKGMVSEINVTPLVDVMLVLLIIFMVTAPLITTGVKVDLPAVKTPTLETREDKLVLAITKDRRVFLADTEIPMEQLQVKLRANARLQREKELFLHADRNLSYGVVMEVMASRCSGGRCVSTVMSSTYTVPSVLFESALGMTTRWSPSG